jgi:alpha-L-fucosidase
MRGAENYVPETDPLVLQKLEKWQDLKFGLLMHWGAYSQWGIVESWSICSEDEEWCRRKNPDYEAYKKDYTALKRTFNPIRFDPGKWAAAARDAGMKYVVFTTAAGMRLARALREAKTPCGETPAICETLH